MRLARRPGWWRAFAALAVVVMTMFTLLPAASAGGSGHKVRFLILASDPTANPTVLAFGAIHARGTDVVVNDSRDRFVFDNGALRVRHTSTSGSDSFDPVTCLGTFRETGTYRIVGGSGAYKHAHGFGRYRVTVTVVGCDETALPDVFQQRISASGPIWF